MTVYVTQEARGRDISDALAYGDIEILIPATEQAYSSSDAVVFQMEQKLKDFNSQDYLLLSGDPIAIGLSFIFAARANNGAFKVLKWDRLEEKYYPISIKLPSFKNVEDTLLVSEDTVLGLDTKVIATCSCGEEERVLKMRTVKNTWPTCSCGTHMKVRQQNI